MKPTTKYSLQIILVVSAMLVVARSPHIYATVSKGESDDIWNSVIELVLGLTAVPLIFGVFWIAARLLVARDRFVARRRRLDDRHPRDS